jgi:hypothetical protein
MALAYAKAVVLNFQVMVIIDIQNDGVNKMNKKSGAIVQGISSAIHLKIK